MKQDDKNPFNRLLSWTRWSKTRLTSRQKSPNAISQDWDHNLTPFSNQSGQAREEFKGYQRIRGMQFFLLFIFGILFVRMLQLKVVRGEELRAQADINYKKFNQIRAHRGIIYDRYDLPLATNEPSYSMVFNTNELPEDAQGIDALLENINTVSALDVPNVRQTIQNGINRDQARIPIQTEIDREQAFQILTQQQEYPGLNIEILPKRSYPLGQELAHVIGYTTEVYDYEIEKDDYYLAGDRTGREGLEKKYESYLRGIKGIGVVEINATGQQVSTRIDPDQTPQTGHNLILTLDSELQKVAYEALANGIKESQGKGGAAIVMQVNTGEILALVSWPSFDPNIFSTYLSNESLSQLYAPEANYPLFNRAIAGVYPPGSIFKPIVATAALERGTITTYTYINDPGFLEVGGSRFPCWVYGQYGSSHGSLNVIGALSKSCDVFFYEVGAGYDNIEGLGSETIKLYAQDFGLGQTTGIDLPGEATGSVPAKSDLELEGKQWYWGNTAHMAIGQAYTMITPIQMVNAIAAIANGGTLYQPHLVQSIEPSSYANGAQFEPRIIADNLASHTSIDIVRQGMRAAVNASGGTAAILNSLPVQVAGKTGTAQHNKNKQDHAWFVSFSPYDDPEIATLVLVEEGGEGSKVAAPITKEILDWYFNNR